MLYTPRFGPTTPGDASGTDVVLEGVALPLTPTGVRQAFVRERRPATGGIPIAPDTLVLNGPEGSALDALLPGSPVVLTLSITRGGRTAGSHRRTRVHRDRCVTLISPRPAIADAVPADGAGNYRLGWSLMATVDGRQPGYSTGVDLEERPS